MRLGDNLRSFLTTNGVRAYYQGMLEGFFVDGLKGDVDAVIGGVSFLGKLLVDAEYRREFSIRVGTGVVQVIDLVARLSQADIEQIEQDGAAIMVALLTRDVSRLNTRQLGILLKTNAIVSQIEVLLWETAAEKLKPHDFGRLAGMIAYEVVLDAAIGAATAGAASPGLAARLPVIAAKLRRIPGGGRLAREFAPDGRIYKLVMDLAETVTKTRNAANRVASRQLDRHSVHKERSRLPARV